MSSSDALRHLLIGFFRLLSDIELENITQKAVHGPGFPGFGTAYSRATRTFNVDFDVEQLESL